MPGKWTRQKFNCVYQMVDPHKKNEIIHDINRGIINTNVKSGIKSNWWTNKHHPNKLIPSRIYELGSGTLEELEQRYFDKYEKIKDNDKKNHEQFLGYTRELVQQKIMIEIN